MPKKIITVDTLPIALSLLHNWQGKLTWQRYSETLAYRLNVERIAKRSLYKHDEIVTVFNQVKNRLNQQKAFPHSPDATIQELRKELESVKSQLQHEKQKTHNLQNAFLRLQRNMYMLPGMDLEKLKKLLTEPLPNEVAREGR